MREVLDNYREHIFDGIVIDDGRRRPALRGRPEVARTAERGVTLTITAAEAARAAAARDRAVGVQAARRREAVAPVRRRLAEE